MTTNEEARQIKAGEYIQHLCGKGKEELGEEHPEISIFPPDTLFGGGVVTSRTTPMPAPAALAAATEPHQNDFVTDSPTTKPIKENRWDHLHHITHGMSWQWILLLCILAALCIAGIVTSVVCCMRSRDYDDDDEDYMSRRGLREHSFDFQQGGMLPYGVPQNASFMQPQPGMHHQMPSTMPVFPGGGPYPPYTAVNHMPGY